VPTAAQTFAQETKSIRVTSVLSGITPDAFTAETRKVFECAMASIVEVTCNRVIITSIVTTGRRLSTGTASVSVNYSIIGFPAGSESAATAASAVKAVSAQALAAKMEEQAGVLGAQNPTMTYTPLIITGFTTAGTTIKDVAGAEHIEGPTPTPTPTPTLAPVTSGATISACSRALLLLASGALALVL
jgi:hypothetical protein